MGHQYLLGLDAGTSVIKSVIFDLEGNEIAIEKAEVPIDAPQPGWSEQDMDAVWEAAKKTMREVVQKVGLSPHDIALIGTTAQGSGCWMIDSQGRPARKAIIWTDSRAKDIVSDWEKEGIGEKAFSICGSVQYSGFQGPIVRWLKDNEPDSLQRTRWILYCKDWIKFKLTGKVSTDGSDHAQTLLDTSRYMYSEEIFNLYGINDLRHLFPEIVTTTLITGELVPEVAQEIGLKAGLPVIGGPFDIIATAIGVGAIGDRDAFTILGTTCANNVVLGKPIFEPKGVGMTLCHGLPKKWVKSLSAMLGTANLDWFLQEFALEDKLAAQKEGRNFFEYLDGKINEVASSNGVIYHPYLSPAGERAPFVKPTARAQFFGLTYQHTRHHLLRAVYEGVALAVRDCYESIPISTSEITLSGGGARSDVWARIIADVTGKVVKVPEGSEFGAKGAVLNGAVALGIYDSYHRAVEETLRFARTYEPDPANTRKYDELWQIYRQIYHDVWDAWDRLSSLQTRLWS